MKKMARVRKPWWGVLVREGACPEALKWAKNYRTFWEAWRACHEWTWMMWWLDKCGLIDHDDGSQDKCRRCELIDQLKDPDAIRARWPDPPMPAKRPWRRP